MSTVIEKEKKNLKHTRLSDGGKVTPAKINMDICSGMPLKDVNYLKQPDTLS
jgi:hypothetical protein